jgi:WD40 repeat protein
MAESSQAPKRQKTTTKRTRKIAITVDTILNIDSQSFQKDVKDIDFETSKRLLERLSELSQAVEDARTKFLDIPPSVIVARVFPYLNRTDWNNFSMANKEIHYADKNHKTLLPPWPDRGCLWDATLSISINPPHLRLCGPTFSPNTQFVAFYDNGDGLDADYFEYISNRNGRIHVWGRRGLLKSWEGHDGPISSLLYSPDGTLLVSSGRRDGTIRFWDTATNDYRCVRVLTTEDNLVKSFAFSPNGEFIAAIGADSVTNGTGPLLSRGTRVIIYKVSDGTRSQTLRPIEVSANIQRITTSPDGTTLAYSGKTEDGLGYIDLWCWSFDSGRSGASIRLEHSNDYGTVVALAFSADSAYLASMHAYGSTAIILWNVHTKQCVRTLDRSIEYLSSVSFSPDGKTLVTAGYLLINAGGTSATITLWSVADGSCLERIILAGARSIGSLDISKNGRALLTQEDGKIRLRSTSIFALER